MTYFGFLARFVVFPWLLLTALNAWMTRRGRRLPDSLRGVPAEAAVAGLAATAFLYTTPWDNYLVATKVWWYDPKRVVGKVIGWVPVEEYSFFVLQTLFTSAWLVFLGRVLPEGRPTAQPLRYRVGLTLALGAVWAWAVFNLFRGPKARTYMSITLAWALLPLMFQTAFGGDILWRHRRLIALGIIPTTLYLGASDSIAIEGGNWTISPEKSVNRLIGGKLPFEEGLFFFITNVLITLGFTLVVAKDSQRRVPPFFQRLLRLRYTDG
jgi:lycopene cyclase domain-containing protein